MVGGGDGSFIGDIHRIAARLDDEFVLVAGALSSTPEKSRCLGASLRLAPERIYCDFQQMARAEAVRADGIDAVAIVTPNYMHAAPAIAFLDAGIHVICEKPLTATIQDAREVVKAAEASGALFFLTYNYTAYPMVRQMRRMLGDGRIGDIRLVAVEYVQGWLATPIETTGSKQAEWRTDAKRSGSGAIGDIGTHAFNLAEFVTGLAVNSVSAEANTFVPGRQVDDNAFMLLRFGGGAQGLLWCSQVAIGEQNALSIRVFGDKGTLKWRQEAPEVLQYSPLGKAQRIILRGVESQDEGAAYTSRVPAGLPEGYLEGFAQLYADVAAQIRARKDAREPAASVKLVPGIEEGLRRMLFITAALSSSARNGAWTPV
jgi:predicted dehydrogenase